MSETGNKHIDRRRNLLLWLGVLGPGATWLLYLQTAYLLVHYACKNGNQTPLHITSALFLFSTIAFGILGGLQFRKDSLPADEVEEQTVSRIRLMSRLSFVQGAEFALIITGSWIAISILSPCLS